MKPKSNNFAYIDAANLYNGVNSSGWKLDYRRLRVWLSEKYGVAEAYLFIGLIPRHKDLYTLLQEAGYTLVFKETTYGGEGVVKGNCDADLVLWAVRGAYEEKYEKAVLVSSDGDYASLVKFLQEKNKLRGILSPRSKCSILLKRTNAPITYLQDVRSLINAQKEKAPDTDGTV